MGYESDLQDLQKKEGNISEVTIIGFIFVVIVSMILITKTIYFNSMRKIKEDSEMSYQNVAMYALGIWIFITFFMKYIF
jgi:hypothetical protein